MPQTPPVGQTIVFGGLPVARHAGEKSLRRAKKQRFGSTGTPARHSCLALLPVMDGTRLGRRPTPRPTNGLEKGSESRLHLIKWGGVLKSSSHDGVFQRCVV